MIFALKFCDYAKNSKNRKHTRKEKAWKTLFILRFNWYHERKRILEGGL